MDEVPPPFQYPPGANTSERVLPDNYMYFTESHLNWNVVYTINRTTMEIVGISDSVCTDLIDPSVAQCRDGECKRLRCYPAQYSVLKFNRSNFCSIVKAKESQRTTSYEGYGAIASVSTDDFGYMVDFVGKMPNKESELDPKVIYRRQFNMSTCSPCD